MKKCPACSRTYSDETLSFCLEDGSLLSASSNLYEEQKTVVRQNSADLPPTQFLYQPTAARNEIPTIVTAKNTNPVYERQSVQNSYPADKSLTFLLGKLFMKLSFGAVLFILFITIMGTAYMRSRIPATVGLIIALIYLAKLWIKRK